MPGLDNVFDAANEVQRFFDGGANLFKIGCAGCPYDRHACFLHFSSPLAVIIFPGSNNNTNAGRRKNTDANAQQVGRRQIGSCCD
jgi:hypothetical protein